MLHAGGREMRFHTHADSLRRERGEGGRGPGAKAKAAGPDGVRRGPRGCLARPEREFAGRQ